MTARTLIVASHRIQRMALRQALDDHGVDVVADCSPGPDAVVAAITARPAVVLVDAASDGAAGIDTCVGLARSNLPTRVVALVPRVGPTREAVRTAGAAGVVTTDVSLAELVRFLGAIAEARPSSLARTRASRSAEARLLTDREREVLALAATGLTDGQISRALYISYKTVRNHLHHVYDKLGTRSRTEAVTVGLRHGLISL